MGGDGPTEGVPLVTTSRDHFLEFYTEEYGGPPAWVWAICSQCKGHGTSTAYLGAYTQADREEMGEEWYEFVDNVRAGYYDRACPECAGSGKVQEFSGHAQEQWFEWLTEEYADAHTRWAESGYPQ